ncbi:MAG: hypothetical protein OCD76_02865 [Reichenbachiella sp.]
MMVYSCQSKQGKKTNEQVMDSTLLDQDSVVMAIASTDTLVMENVVIKEEVSVPAAKPKVVSKKKRGTGRVPLSDNSDQYRLRRFAHVSSLYNRLLVPVTNMSVQYNVPPAAVLGIISLESGWGNGYVGQITGNVMSLGARRGDAELPSLMLPIDKKTNEVILDDSKLSQYDSSQIRYESRPESLKKDYRPKGIAGSTKNLAYFSHHPDERLAAELKNVEDFLTIFISENSRIKAYRDARAKMDAHVAKDGVESLFTIETSEEFIHAIGGRPNTFNYRETWPVKVKKIMNGAGLVELTKEVYLDSLSFDEAW